MEKINKTKALTHTGKIALFIITIFFIVLFSAKASIILDNSENNYRVHSIANPKKNETLLMLLFGISLLRLAGITKKRFIRSKTIKFKSNEKRLSLYDRDVSGRRTKNKRRKYPYNFHIPERRSYIPERRSSIERRKYFYDCHIPERRILSYPKIN